MLDVTVKTLDGQNRSFSVPDDMTVRQFKDRIAGSINVTADTQRLIFQGRVLQDEKLLKDYDVHGKVVHVVMRAPPSSGRGQSNNDAPPTSSASGRDPNSRVVGSFTLPADILNANMVQNIAQDAVRSMGNLGRNARVSTRSSPDGSNVDVHIHLGPMQGGQTSEAQMRLNTARQMIRLANEAINQYENPEGQEGAGSGAGSTPAESNGTQGSSSAPASTATTDRPTTHSPMETSDTEDDRTTSDSTAASTESARAMETGSGTTTTTARGTSTTTTGTSSTSATGTSTDSQSEQASQQGATPRGPVRPNIGALGEVLLDVQQLNQRIQPYMERFQRIVQEDGELTGADQRSAQNVSNLVLEVMHSIGHGYHALSDLMVDLSQQRPRQLYVTLTIAHPHTTVIQQTIPVQVPIPLSMAAPGSGVSTASTGTSTPRPSTAETGTQPSTTSTGTAGVQVGGAGLSEAEINRMTEEMTAGIQNVIGQGLQQGDGSPDNPFVFVEMRPDSMTVNSISAEVVTTSEPGTTTADGASSTTGEASGPQPPQATPTTQPQATRPQGQAPPTQSQATPQAQISGQSGFLQQLLEVTGVNGGGPQRMQIQIGGQRPPAFPGMAGMGPGAHGFMFGPMMMRAGAPVSESGTQTAAAGARPANSATQTSTPTSTFGTQTSTSSSTPSSTSGTQTPQGPPRTTAFVLPGMHGAHGPQGLLTLDPHLQCSSRHFLTRYARSMMNEPSPANDTGLADMVGNLMSGLLGATNRGPRPTAPSSTANTESHPGAGTQSGQPRPTAPTGPQAQRAQMMGGLPPFFPGRMPFIPGMTMRMSMPRPPTSQATPTSSSQTPPTASAQPSSASSSGSGGVGGGQAGENQFVQMLRSMLQTANAGTGAQPTPSSTTGGTATTTDQNQNIQPQSGTSSQPISDEAFTQLVSGITGFMAQAAMGQAPRQTITDFLSQLGDNYNLPMGEGFINEGLSCILAHLQITDLIQVFYGNAQALNQVQGPLRGFILTRVLNGAPPTQENIRASVIRLIEQMEPEIQETVNSVTPRPHIDFHGTLVNFFHQQFTNVVSLIINARDGDINFGQDLYSCIRRLLSELFILCSRCLGGMAAVQQLVTQRLQTLTTGINPMVQEWMNSMTARQLCSFIPTINITESEVSFYVVYTGQTFRESATTTTQPSPSVSTTQKPASPTATQTKAPAPAANKPTPPPRPQTNMASNSVKLPPQRVPSPDKAPVNRRDSEKVSSSSQPMDTSPISSASEGSSENQDLPRAAQGAEGGQEPVTTTSNGRVSTAVNGRDWEAVVPSDWVPVIKQDIEKQQNQPPQTPHSDIYLQGMPPKRRKIMTEDKPNNLSNVADAFPDSVRRAVAAARVEPISSLENLTAEAANDTDLQCSYDSELQSSLTCRVNSDSDYKSERFPNTEDYYHKTDGDKK